MKIQKNIVRIINFLRSGQLAYFFSDMLLKRVLNNRQRVIHNGVTLDFMTPNALNAWRAQTFSTKEPETLAWIDAMPREAILWDVGANIGLYSCYASKARNCRVFAFEPSVFNLEILARNVFINELVDKVTIAPLPLSDTLGENVLRMTTTEWGGALSTFGKDFGWDGKDIQQVFEFCTTGISMDEAVERLKYPIPDFIKMDVDGLEHYILQGGANVLSHIMGILIEVNDNFHEQSESCRYLLEEAGLTMTGKFHSELIASSLRGFQTSYNQIWARL